VNNTEHDRGSGRSLYLVAVNRQSADGICRERRSAATGNRVSGNQYSMIGEVGPLPFRARGVYGTVYGDAGLPWASETHGIVKFVVAHRYAIGSAALKYVERGRQKDTLLRLIGEEAVFYDGVAVSEHAAGAIPWAPAS